MRLKRFAPFLLFPFVGLPIHSFEIETSVENIVKEFEANSIVAEEKFLKKKIKLTDGEISSIDDAVYSDSGFGEDDISVKIYRKSKGDFDFNTDSVNCAHRRNESIIRKLRKGMKVDIIGVLVGESYGLTFKDCKYISAELNSTVNGKGTYIYSNGTEYVGDFIDGNFNGKGIMNYADGSKYVGDFVNDELDGQGTLYWANGDKYIGDWKQGKQHGKGELFVKDHLEYKGDYLDGKKEGIGVLDVLGTKNKYEGEFKNDLPNGIGRLSDLDGNSKCVVNENGNFKSFCNDQEKAKEVVINQKILQSFQQNKNKPIIKTINYANGTYTGEVKGDDIWNGQGTLTLNDGIKYVGEFKNMKLNGIGKYYKNDFLEYEGNHVNDLREGKGILDSKQGNKWEGEFKNNQQHGIGTFTWADGSSACMEMNNGEFKRFCGSYSD